MRPEKGTQEKEVRDGKELAVTDSDFDQEVLQADTLVLVDFWAEWCRPCHQLDPIIAELAEEYDGRIKFVKLDTEENFDTAARYGIMSLPALLVFNNGEQVEAITGLRPKDDLKRSLDKALA